jgi:hypothetical protein
MDGDSEAVAVSLNTLFSLETISLAVAKGIHHESSPRRAIDRDFKSDMHFGNPRSRSCTTIR